MTTRRHKSLIHGGKELEKAALALLSESPRNMSQQAESLDFAIEAWKDAVRSETILDKPTLALIEAGTVLKHASLDILNAAPLDMTRRAEALSKAIQVWRNARPARKTRNSVNYPSG